MQVLEEMLRDRIPEPGGRRPDVVPKRVLCDCR